MERKTKPGQAGRINFQLLEKIKMGGRFHLVTFNKLEETPVLTMVNKSLIVLALNSGLKRFKILKAFGNSNSVGG